jgi:hypothetical protein
VIEKLKRGEEEEKVTGYVLPSPPSLTQSSRLSWLRGPRPHLPGPRLFFTHRITPDGILDMTSSYTTMCKHDEVHGRSGLGIGDQPSTSRGCGRGGVMSAGSASGVLVLRDPTPCSTAPTPHWWQLEQRRGTVGTLGAYESCYRTHGGKDGSCGS